MRNLENAAEKMRQDAGRTRSSTRATYAALLYAKLSILAARKGDEDAYRQAAMKVGGLVSAGRAAASRAVLLRLAEAATLLGQPDAAQQYLDQSGVSGPERDAVLALIVERLLHEHRRDEATRLLGRVRDEEALVRARHAAAKAQAAAPDVKLSAVFEEIQVFSRL